MDNVLISGLKRENFQAVVQGKETDLFVLTNSNGMEVCITNYGGAIMAIMDPDKEGKMANVIQGHDSIQNMINSPEPFLSTLVGRYGNRIAKGHFVMNGKDYSLATTGQTTCMADRLASMHVFGMLNKSTSTSLYSVTSLLIMRKVSQANCT